MRWVLQTLALASHPTLFSVAHVGPSPRTMSRTERYNVEMTANRDAFLQSGQSAVVATDQSRGPAKPQAQPTWLSVLAFGVGAAGAVGASSAFSRRQALLTAAVAAMASKPAPANASYALYAASQESYDTRKKEKWVPVATSDIGTLAEIQADLDMKRPDRKKIAAKRKDVYCAGVTSAVSPLMENRCRPENTGISKADQTTGRTIAAWEEQMGKVGSTNWQGIPGS